MVNFFLFIMFFSPFSPASLSSRLQISVKKYQLENGMTVLLNSYNQSRICSYLLGISTGSRHEQEGITGISHMFEHLMFKGTKKYPSFDQAHSRSGIIRTNAFTSHDYTAYVASFPCDQLDLILDMESDRMVNLTFTQEELDKERQAVQEERLLSIDNSPTGQLFELFFKTLFKKHPYKWPIIGSKKDIANYTLKDLRNWYSTYYSPNNATLVLSGNFSERKARKLIQKYFSPLKSKKIPEEVLVKEPVQTQFRYASIANNVQSPYVVMGFKIGSGGTKENLALKTLADILGSGESSRLYKKLVREKKLVPFISVSILGTLQENVFFILYPLLDKSKEEEVKGVIQEEIQKLFTEPISQKDLEKMKNMELSDLVSGLKTSASRVRILSRYDLFYKNYKKIYSDIDDLDSLTVSYIQKVAKKYLDFKKMSYVILKSKK
ncbi:MAG: M16 family metallopeptidase [Bdellovibrionales bacterium]